MGVFEGMDWSAGGDRGFHIVSLGPHATPEDVQAFRDAYDLGCAWAAAEAELPDGWGILSLIFDAGRWGAAAYDASFTGRPWHQRYRRASGDTPVAALIALAGVFQAER